MDHFFYYFFDGRHYRNGEFLQRYPQMVAFPLFLIFSIIILIKANLGKGTLLLALFFSSVSQNICLQFLLDVTNGTVSMYAVWIALSGGLAGTLYIKSFPRSITAANINVVFRGNKIFRKYIGWTLKRYAWVVIFLVITISYLFAQGLYGLLDILILITAFLSLYINYKNATPSERNKILWFFWGILTFTFLRIIELIIKSFDQGNSTIVGLIITSIGFFILIISLLMSLFFFNAFDTGLLIRRTVVDACIFILIVLIYNTLEHYFLHWLSHTMHVSNVLISSFMSGIFVPVFTPVHHKLMHFAEKKIKKHT